MRTRISNLLTRLSAGVALAAALAAPAWAEDGEVKKIDLDTNKITLKHNGIKNLDMPAMQMAFRVADANWLKNLQVGDKVTFSADKVGGQFTVTAISKK